MSEVGAGVGAGMGSLFWRAKRSEGEAVSKKCAPR